MSDFIHELKHDHQVIQQVAAGMSAVAERLESGKQVEPSILADVVQFLRIFAGQCHHTKEEKYLFPLLETKRPVPAYIASSEHWRRSTAWLHSSSTN